MFRVLFCLLTVFIVYPVFAQEKTGQAQIDHYFELVREEYSGAKAFKTVAFVEKYWRLAGNSGFDSSIFYVAQLLEHAGFISEEQAGDDASLTYRIQKRPLKNLTWEPVDAVVQMEGDETPLLTFSTNRNMLALNSWSTGGELVAEVVDAGDGTSLDSMDVRGRIVFAETGAGRLYKKAVIEKGAVGVMVYNSPAYIQPEKYVHSIQFRWLPQDTVNKPWAIVMSYAAKSRLKQKLRENNGRVTLHVNIETRIYPSEELTLVADVKGKLHPDERIVFSAHVQEPGANDNASGVGAQAEMARVTARLVTSGKFVPQRSITFLFGDEIRSTQKYISEDSVRAKGIKWGISLDMVGENTDVTGGTFLIEKMPDPGAVWLRGNDKHTEWGGRRLDQLAVRPHYFNNFVISVFKQQGEFAGWTVNSNPYEGGSDHVPFLRADIPGLLLWHFTDVFYHTDADRIDKVSASTLQNVGTAALVTAYSLINADEEMFRHIVMELSAEAMNRQDIEFELSKAALKKGGDLKREQDILRMWAEYYSESIWMIREVLDSAQLREGLVRTIYSAEQEMTQYSRELIRILEEMKD